MSADQERAALLPCPFCGTSHSGLNRINSVWSVACECGVEIYGFDSEAQAIAAWNTRTTDRQALRADITARYENTLRSLDDGWRSIESAPHDEEILAAIEVHNKLEKWWEIQIICIDNETGEITSDCYNGWDAGDYSHWMPLPAPPNKRATALSDLAALDGQSL
jgi:Lar family restriction alleviation protein